MTGVSSLEPHTDFVLPADRSATEPPEARGLERDGVRLLVAGPSGVEHARFRDLPRFLRPGDLLVVNTSATLPAAVDGVDGDGGTVVVHVARPLAAPDWVVELRRPDGDGPVLDARAGAVVRLAGGDELTLVEPYRDGGGPAGTRLWRARATADGTLGEHLTRYGRPIAYGYLRQRWPLADYQTVFARHPGSAEMASAGRPFTHALVTELVTRAITIAPVVLHAGVSSPEAGEPPAPERFEVPAATAALVTHTRGAGGRVIAVGTTVTRALESVARPDGSVSPGGGETDLVLGPDRPARVVDGLVTGWHEPGASHLLLLEAVAGGRLVDEAYAAGLAGGYLWHEFGDSCLLLPDAAGGSRPRG